MTEEEKARFVEGAKDRRERQMARWLSDPKIRAVLHRRPPDAAVWPEFSTDKDPA